MRKLALVVLVVPAVAAAKPKTIEVDAGNGTLTLSFDPAKVSEADVRAAAALAPESNPDVVLTMSLETCFDATKNTTACGAAPRTPSQPAFFKDAEIALAKNRDLVKAASDRKVPAELEPAKQFLRRHLAFWAGLEERKLAYYRSWNSAALRGQIEGVDGAQCAAITAKVDAAASKDDKYKLVKFSWHNCMNNLGRNLFGDYPAAPWQAFLKAKGIQAKYKLFDSD